MRWVSTFFALALTGALQANALDATIFTFPPKTASLPIADSDRHAVSEDEARLVLELRMKSPVASVLGGVDGNTVNRLNHFAQDDLTLFGGATGGIAPKKSILILDGIDQEVGKWKWTRTLRETLAKYPCSPSHAKSQPRLSSYSSNFLAIYWI